MQSSFNYLGGKKKSSWKYFLLVCCYGQLCWNHSYLILLFVPLRNSSAMLRSLWKRSPVREAWLQARSSRHVKGKMAKVNLMVNLNLIQGISLWWTNHCILFRLFKFLLGSSSELCLCLDNCSLFLLLNGPGPFFHSNLLIGQNLETFQE